MAIGVLLILISVVAGARLVAAADDTSPVYAAATALVAGQPIASSSLTRVDVTLAGTQSLYVAADQSLAGDAVAVRDVRAGELLPASAVGRAADLDVKPVLLPVTDETARMLVAGSVVEVWVNVKAGTSGSEAYGTPSRVLDRATVSRLPSSDTRFSAGAATAGVQVMVPSAQVEKLIAAVDQGAKVTLVPVAGSPVKAAG